jgi:hypothetical protein
MVAHRFGVNMKSSSQFYDSIPDNVKISFFEYKRKEWEKVLEASANSRISETQPESQLHWENINRYAKERIDEIDRQMQQIKLKAAMIGSP